MVRVNKESVFDEIDLEDIASIRRIMVAMKYYLSNDVLHVNADETEALQHSEKMSAHVWLSNIRNTSERHPLLLEATLHFLKAYAKSDSEVFAAVRELETLAPSETFMMADYHERRYAVAEAKFNKARAEFGQVKKPGFESTTSVLKKEPKDDREPLTMTNSKVAGLSEAKLEPGSTRKAPSYNNDQDSFLRRKEELLKEVGSASGLF